MSSAPNADEIARDAHWLAQALDPTAGVVRLIAMNRDSYRKANFLDDRMLQQPVDAQLISWPGIEAAMAAPNLRHDARWIFHIGHAGSTLVSRLLGELPGVLALREPRFLRDLALSPPEVRRRYCAPIPKLMSRTFSEKELALVKATSFVSEIAPELVPRAERALLIYSSATNYMGTILAGENSVKELRMLAPSRAQRLARRVSAIGPAHNDAELAAIAWASEMTSLEAAADAMADRQVAWADFDRLLSKVEPELARIAAFFGFGASEEQLAAVARGPLMSRYSKDLGYDYSPKLRRDLIEEALNLHRPAIDGALAMLHRSAEKSPLLARTLSRAES